MWKTSEYSKEMTPARNSKRFLGSSRIIWYHLGSSEIIWAHRVSSWIIWDHLESSGIIYGQFEPVGWLLGMPCRAFAGDCSLSVSSLVSGKCLSVALASCRISGKYVGCRAPGKQLCRTQMFCEALDRSQAEAMQKPL